AADADAVLVLERRLPPEQGDALALELLGGPFGPGLADDVLLAGHHPGPVEVDGPGPDAERAGTLEEGVDLGGAEQGLGGHAGAVGAVAADLVLLDDGDRPAARPQPLGGRG